MEVIDNFLDKTYFKYIQDMVFGGNFPYYFSPITMGADGKYSGQQLVHMAYRDNRPQSDFYSSLTPCLDKLQVCSVYKIKVNIVPRSDEKIIHNFHVDVTDLPINYKIAILYMNTNNGGTIIKDGDKRIESVENRMIIFPGHLEHTGTTNTDKDIPWRCVINFNYW